MYNIIEFLRRDRSERTGVRYIQKKFNIKREIPCYRKGPGALNALQRFVAVLSYRGISSSFPLYVWRRGGARVEMEKLQGPE